VTTSHLSLNYPEHTGEERQEMARNKKN